MEKEATSLLLFNPKDFPGKLWNLVNNSQISSICWDASGEGILIHKVLFKTEVMLAQTTQISKYFKMRDYASFIRQLNLYGFRKVPSGQVISKKCDNSGNVTQLHHFHNKNFKRDKPDLLLNIKRLTAANKAKLAAGKQLSRRSSHHFCHAVPNSPAKISALMKGPVFFGRQGTPYHHCCNGLKQVKDCDTVPRFSQTPVMNYDASYPVHFYSKKVEPWPVLPLFPMDLPYTHPSIPVHMQHGIMSHHSEYERSSTAYDYCRPDFLVSNLPCSQSAVPYSHYGYYSAQDWKAGGVSGSWNRDPGVNLVPVFKVEDKMQHVGGLECKDVAETTSTE